MSKKESKKQAEEKIRGFFSSLEGKGAREVKKIKRLAMAYNIKLGRLRKRFCKKCYSVFNSKNSEVRVKNKVKRVRCLNCGYLSRWKID